jgi:hypothetical protein
MKELSERLERVVAVAEARLRAISEAESEQPVLKGGWSRKQVIGHLIDSASNNHQRFVRASLQGSLEFPGYDQDGCVRVQAVQQAGSGVIVWRWMDQHKNSLMPKWPGKRWNRPNSGQRNSNSSPH